MLPVDIFKKSDTELAIKWDDNRESIFVMQDLRRQCPCAGCKAVKEKSSGDPLHVLSAAETIPADIQIREAEVVGRYAIKFYWSDGHNEGIYSFDYLRQLDAAT